MMTLESVANGKNSMTLYQVRSKQFQVHLSRENLPKDSQTSLSLSLSVVVKSVWRDGSLQGSCLIMNSTQ